MGDGHAVEDEDADEYEGSAFGRSTDIPVFFSFLMLDGWWWWWWWCCRIARIQSVILMIKML